MWFLNTRKIPPTYLQVFPLLTSRDFPLSTRLQEGAAGEADALDGRVVDEPADAVAGALVDQGAGEAIAVLKDPLHDVLLAAAGGDEGDLDAVVDDGEGEGDALRRGLGGVLDGSDPGGGLA